MGMRTCCISKKSLASRWDIVMMGVELPWRFASLPEGSSYEPLVTRAIMREPQPVGMAWKFGEGVPAQVSSASYDRGSKLRGPSQNSPRVAAKRGVNI
ncbi:hypothetical protein AVEN_40128-1 [Araneus ventricosus]|uniref:Uncharacterized protein n=1 Tax=Araneus ventricosus TaxID=182803 RepID=A0A4Y2ELR7_ARAVE|nr:hypothetical protein AVEN_40128-1 [Araneus ventricosus]